MTNNFQNPMPKIPNRVTIGNRILAFYLSFESCDLEFLLLTG